MNYIIQSINLESDKSRREKRRERKELLNPITCLKMSIANLIPLPHESPSSTCSLLP